MNIWTRMMFGRSSTTKPENGSGKHSVRTLLVWLVLGSLLPAVLGATFLFIYEYRKGREQVEQTTLGTARALMQAVDNQLLRIQAVAQALSTSEVLRRGDFERFHAGAREVMTLSGLGNNVVIRDSAGRQLLNTAVDFDIPLNVPPDAEAVQPTFETAKPVISNLFIGPVLNRPLLSVQVPVYVDGRVQYELGVGVLPEQFDRLLKSQNLPEGWLAGIFDGNGTFVSRSRSAAEVVGSKPSPNMLTAMLKSMEGSVETTTREGIDVISSFSRSPLTGWRVSIAIPVESFRATLLRTLGILAAGVLVLIALALLIARFMGSRIAAAVEALIPPALALGRGEAPTVPDLPLREAEQVATAIERAGELLEERDRELRRRDMELFEAHRLARFGTWHWDPGTRELQASDSLRHLCTAGLDSFEDLRGLLLPEAVWDRLNVAPEVLFERGRPQVHELLVKCSTEPIWIESRFQAVRDERTGRPVLRGTVQDITERKKAAERQHEAEERFRLLADNIPQLAWMADREGKIVWVNRRWTEFTGLDAEQTQQRWRQLPHPMHAANSVASWEHSFRTGTPWHQTFLLRGRDGGYRWFLSQAVPQVDDSGEVLRWFGSNTDVSDELEVQDELRRFKFFSDHANDVHLLFDHTGRVRYANRLACERLGYTEEELLALDITAIDVLHPLERLRTMFDTDRRARIPPFESIHRRKDGTTIPVDVTATVLEQGDEVLLFEASRDVSERKISEQRLRDAALHDPLTGLPNRALVFEHVGRLLAGARRGHGQGALLFIDLDRFKPINDLHGHDIGDRVLKEVAKRLVACTRSEDLVGRLGGDEFVIVLSHVEPDPERAAAVARHVVNSIGQIIRVDTLELSVTPSIGISYFPEHATDPSELLHAADLAMYQAKRTGRANFQFYTPELDENADHVRTLELTLKDALKRDRLQLHYQPVIDLASGRLVGAEALVRLADREGRPVSPDTFIPVAESAGMIGELGQWVAAEACRQREQWRREGLEVNIAINVSPFEFRQRTFPERLIGIIQDAGLDPSAVEIELTESTVMESVEDAIATLGKLKLLGVKVTLDDFGTGYSSLSSLSNLPLDKLKVDQSFVRRLDQDQASRAVTEAVIALARSLKLEVVGEGIESELAMHYLREHGCDLAQGFWYSRPLPPAEFLQWSQTH